MIIETIETINESEMYFLFSGILPQHTEIALEYLKESKTEKEFIRKILKNETFENNPAWASLSKIDP